MQKTILLAAISALWSCKPVAQMSDPLADDASRIILGMDNPYPAKDLSAGEQNQLDENFAKRRLFGWQTLQNAFSPLMLQDDQGQSRAVALWQSWFTSDEIEKIFQYLYVHLPKNQRFKENLDGKVPVQPVNDSLLQCVLKDYLSEKRLKERYGKTLFNKLIRQRISQLKKRDARSLNGVAAGTTLFSIGTVRHYLKNYAKIIACTSKKVENADPSEFAPCFFEEFPKDAAAIKAIWARDDEDIELFDTSAQGIKDAISQKKIWLPSCTTGNCKISAGSSRLDQEMYSAHVVHTDGSSNTFRLTGLHIVTKEVRDWTWTSLFWSENPNTDFGEDRPDWFGTYQGHSFPELQHYKMCNVTNFDEKDAGLIAKIPAYQKNPKTFDPDSLLAAQLATYTNGASGVMGRGQVPSEVHTWCSNPYVEKDDEMADTNCIGCHQRAGPDGDLEYSRKKLVHNFPSDYSFAFEFYMAMSGSSNDNIREKFVRNADALYDEPEESCGM